MKLNKVFITYGIIIFIIIIVIFTIYFIFNKKNTKVNIQKNNYEIEITAITSGTDEFGNTLQGNEKKYKYSIKNNMTFYETYSNELTTDAKNNIIGSIMKIKKINKKDVVVETKDGNISIEYGKVGSVNSLLFLADNLNCVYYYKIVVNNKNL